LSPEDAAAAPSAEGLQDVFDGLRARVADQAEGDFSAQYLKLAHTYLEMDMLDEAMSSLETAVRSPVHRFEAASLLGRLHVRRGQPQRAIDWLERAAEAPAPTTEDGRALLYDLGVLLDGAGEVARALAVFLELQADAGDYRDVPARIDRLARVQTGG
jgi:tetratricopeptide (TPR) repeat protein